MKFSFFMFFVIIFIVDFHCGNRTNAFQQELPFYIIDSCAGLFTYSHTHLLVRFKFRRISSQLVDRILLLPPPYIPDAVSGHARAALASVTPLSRAHVVLRPLAATASPLNVVDSKEILAEKDALIEEGSLECDIPAEFLCRQHLVWRGCFDDLLPRVG